MASRVCVFVFLFFCFAFLFNSVLSNWVCPHPPPFGQLAVPIGKAFTAHPRSQVEWYKVSGSLCILDRDQDAKCNNPVGFTLATTMQNVTSENTTFILTSTTFELTYDSEHYTATTYGLPPIYPNPDQPFDLLFESYPDPTYAASYDLVSGFAGAVGSQYNVIAYTPNMTANLILRSLSPLMNHGDGGFVGQNLPPPYCDSFIFVSMPQLETWGVIRLNDEINYVNGLTWFDHEWGVFGVENEGDGWIQIEMHLGNGSLYINVPRTDYQFNYTQSLAELEEIDGSMSSGLVTNVEILTNWTSPVSGNIYPVELRIQTDLIEVAQVHITTLFLDQEVTTLLDVPTFFPLYEGDASARVEQGTLSQGRRLGRGSGQLELVGFTSQG